MRKDKGMKEKRPDSSRLRTEETEEGLGEDRKDPASLNAFEHLYEHFRGVPLKYIDLFIGICVAALVVVVALGILKGRGVF